ncbi:hypothetical protein V9T40_001740 [Parthenolecanium corni]|uniref:Transmembrane protein n=1 Tax=Parthenolecanium corni TaxID=536013 RepID=A0AAN9TT88_9HEMI
MIWLFLAVFFVFVALSSRHIYDFLADREWSTMPVVPEEVLARQKTHRYPYCVVWTPIPILSWICPLIGHTGIATSEGKIRDFAGSYYVAEDDMAFGAPTKVWRLSIEKVPGGRTAYDHGVREASLDYGGRVHNLFLDNCHSHVAKALNVMEYDGKSNWSVTKIGFHTFISGQYVNLQAWFRTWGPFWILLIALLLFFGIPWAIRLTEFQ